MQQQQQQDGIHGMVPRDRMETKARARRDCYAITPDQPLIQCEFGYYSKEAWFEQGLDPNTDFSKEFGFNAGGSTHLGGLGWCEAALPTEQHRVPRFLSNSWGDRNRDSRIQEAFMLQEIDRAAELGVEVVQIDDGWQRGRSANSAEAEAKSGVWSGFLGADPEFWKPDPVRFPNGLKPLLERASARAMHIGLWYAPDSWQEFRNWERDARQIVALHREYGVNHFKLDGILPIGDAPDGLAWTGFISCGAETNGGYAVLFNEKNPAASCRFKLPRSFAAVEVLSGTGEARLDGDGLVAALTGPFGYLFVRLAGPCIDCPRVADEETVDIEENV